jgi:hypothetical protein
MSKALNRITLMRRYHERLSLQTELLFMRVVSMLKVTLIGA